MLDHVWTGLSIMPALRWWHLGPSFSDFRSAEVYCLILMGFSHALQFFLGTIPSYIFVDEVSLLLFKICFSWLYMDQTWLNVYNLYNVSWLHPIKWVFLWTACPPPKKKKKTELSLWGVAIVSTIGFQLGVFHFWAWGCHPITTWWVGRCKWCIGNIRE